MYTKGTLLPAYLSRPLLLRGRSAIQNYAQTKQKNKTRSYAISSFSDSVYFPTLGSSFFRRLLLLRLLLLFLLLLLSFFFRPWCLFVPAGLSLVPFSRCRSFSGPFLCVCCLMLFLPSSTTYICFCFKALAAWGGNQNV